MRKNSCSILVPLNMIGSTFFHDPILCNISNPHLTSLQERSIILSWSKGPCFVNLILLNNNKVVVLDQLFTYCITCAPDHTWKCIILEQCC